MQMRPPPRLAAPWPGRDDRLGFGFFERPGGRLMAYGMARQPDGKKSPTVVYASYLPMATHSPRRMRLPHA